MVNSDFARRPAEASSPAQRKLSSARPDEEAPRGELWVLLRSVVLIIALVAVLGWIIS